MFKSQIIFWTKVAVAALSLFWLISRIRTSALVDVLRSSNWNYLILALVLLIPNILIQVFKWHYLLRMANRSVSFSTAFQSLLVGYPLGFVTPGRLGEIGRAFFVKEISQSKTFRLVVLDKITNFIIIVFAGLLGLLLLYWGDLAAVFKAVLLVTAGALASFIFLAALSDSAITRSIGRFIKIYHFSARNSAVLFLFSSLFYLVFLAQFVSLVFSFHTVNLLPAVEALGSVFLLKTILPISLGDLGVREGAAVFFLTKINMSKAAAFNASFLLFLINVGIPTLIGLPTLFRGKKQIHD